MRVWGFNGFISAKNQSKIQNFRNFGLEFRKKTTFLKFFTGKRKGMNKLTSFSSFGRKSAKTRRVLGLAIFHFTDVERSILDVSQSV